MSIQCQYRRLASNRASYTMTNIEGMQCNMDKLIKRKFSLLQRHNNEFITQNKIAIRLVGTVAM